MSKTIRTLSAAALAGSLTLSLASVASAQNAPPPPPQGAPGGQAHHWDPAQMRAHMEERRQHRQQLMHDALGIRPDQEAAWQAFVASRQPPEGERGPGMRHRDGAEGGPPGQHEALTTPQRLDRLQARMAERQQHMAQRIDAIRRFYAALDPRQQKSFDALSHMERGGTGGFGHRHHGDMGGMGGHGGWGEHRGPGGPGRDGGPPGPPPGERG